MYKLRIGILARTQKEEHDILNVIYYNGTIKERGKDWCECDDILYLCLPNLDMVRGTRLDQIIIADNMAVDFNTINSIVINSCVPYQYKILKWKGEK